MWGFSSFRTMPFTLIIKLIKWIFTSATTMPSFLTFSFLAFLLNANGIPVFIRTECFIYIHLIFDFGVRVQENKTFEMHDFGFPMIRHIRNTSKFSRFSFWSKPWWSKGQVMRIFDVSLLPSRTRCEQTVDMPVIWDVVTLMWRHWKWAVSVPCVIYHTCQERRT